MQQIPTASARFATLEHKVPIDEYNPEHFRTTHLLKDGKRTLTNRGILPGEVAPDFELPRSDGGTLRLSALRGQPVILHFGSSSWPITTGSVEPLKKLHARRHDLVHFVDVLIRQAHPGPGVRPYRSIDAKMRDAQRHTADEGIPWPVLVDDLGGTVHQVYSGLAGPIYLIDADGRVAYYTMWTHAPNLNEAIEALLAQGDRGVVNGGIDHVMHLLPAMTHGWRGIRRGLPQSYIDLETAAPGMGSGIWLGYQARSVLAPLTLRAEPLTSTERGVLTLGAVVAGMFAVRALRR